MADRVTKRDWAVVGAYFLASAVWQGSAMVPYTIVLKPLSADFGWTRGEVSLEATIRFGLFALCAPLVATLTQRYGSRGLMTAGGLVLAGALIAVSQINALWQLYGLAFAVGFGASSVSFVVVGTGITQRFRRHRALAIGLATSGSAVGGLIMATLLTQVLVNFGWRAVLFVGGLIAGMITVAILGLLTWAGPVPSDKAERADHRASGRDVGPTDRPASAPARSFTLSEALRSVPFWVLAFAFVGDAFGASAVGFHLVPHLTDLGHAPEVAALAFGALGMAGMPYRLGMGYLADRLRSKQYASMLAAGMNIASMLLLTQAVGAVELTLWVAIAGAMMVTPSLMPVLVSNCFGIRAHAQILGWVSLIGLLGFAFGSGLGGVAFDHLGSYDLLFKVYAGVYGLVGVLYFFVRPPRGQRVVVVR